jgi:hypothetical protein
MPQLVELKALFIIIWRQGIKRNTRFQFWSQLFSILKNNPSVFVLYISICAHLEHFIDYREVVRNEIEGQIADYRAANIRKSQKFEMNESLIA